VVLHKRAGKGSPGRWYVTTSGDLALPLIGAYVDRYASPDPSFDR
jgi:hypothetical protein